MKTAVYILPIFQLLLLLFCTGKKDKTVVTAHQKWHTITLNFEGSETSETAEDNPFLNYRLTVDFQNSNPQWKEGKGKGLIGALNYLAYKGMNSVYFLTMNINGDGKDVWPYRTPEDFTRFGVSKLDQWEIELDLLGAEGNFEIGWFNPDTGGELLRGSVETLEGGGKVSLDNPPKKLGNETSMSGWFC